MAVASRIGLRILLAEDNRVNQVIARTILEKLGAHVQLCGDGFQTLAAVAQGTFDLILMDCQMPGLDGYQATGRIRALEAPQGARTPIIALTAHAMLGDREKCLAAGMDDYLTKPITRDNLEQMLRR